MAFHPLEIETIDDFSGARELGSEWTGSPLYELVLAASSTKSAFARNVVASLATEAGVDFAGVPGRTGGRRKAGKMVCEIKFSTELPARFQQVRPPDDGYDYLLGIGAHPDSLVYWLIPAADVEALIEQKEISVQHASTSLWFFPHATQPDAFSPFRMNAEGLIDALRSFA
jgi:hypothetical protein